MEISNNNVCVVGRLASGFKFDHEVYGEGFYSAYIEVERLSKEKDILPVMVSERLLDMSKDYYEKRAAIKGQFRSFNQYGDSGKRKLVLNIFALEIEVLGDSDEMEDENEICLDGYICKPPVYRETPFGREISDLLIAVNRSYGKSDYIPCIAWGRNARYAFRFEVGTRVKVWGRIQSREYTKKFDEAECEKRVAYETSIYRMERGWREEQN